MKKRVLALMLAGAMLFAFTGCQTANPGTTADKGATQGVTDTSVTIANSAATSGNYAPVGIPFVAGIEAYVKMVNANGGIDGREIVYNHYTDDEFDPVKGKAALSGIVEDLKAFAVVGHFGTPVVAATVEDLKEYGIPAVYFATGIGQLYAAEAKTNAEGYNIFPIQPIYRNEGRIMTAYAVGHFGAAKIGVVYTNDDAGMDIYNGVLDQVATLEGIEVVAEQVTAGTADVSAAVTSIKNAGVDFVVVASIQATFPTIVKELAAQSVNKDCITTYVNVSNVYSAAVVEDITGKFDVYGLGWVVYDDLDAVALYQEWAPAEYAANPYAQSGWIAASFFCEGLKRLEGQELTWESYMKALEESPVKNPFGGFVNFAGGQRLGTQEMNLSKVVPVSDEFPLGWEQIMPLSSVNSLLGIE